MVLNFTKMHGCGNDYIFLPPDQSEPKDLSGLSRRLSRRRYSVGADGLVTVYGNKAHGFGIRIFNADGSEGMTCGNALRCAALFLYRRGYTDKQIFELDTASGKRRVEIGDRDLVTVDMGRATVITDPSGLPMLNRPVYAGGVRYRMTAVSVGNPHQVIFVPDPSAVPLESIGDTLEHNLPGGVNTEFVRVNSRSSLTVRVHERGSGETHACGSGAAASAAVAVLSGRADPNVHIETHFRGGCLSVTVTDELDIRLTGNAVFVYDGRCEL